MPFAPSCAAAWLRTSGLTIDDYVEHLAAPDVRHHSRDWKSWARAEQLPPDGAWRSWVFMGGRGAGKTRAGAEWVSSLARYKGAGRIALIGPTFHDVREVMIEGQSGLRSLPDERPRFEPSRRRVVWANGAQAYCFSAEDPESLRGPQFDAAWADELCFWKYGQETLATLEHALRIGRAPRLMVTTTPRPVPVLKRLLARADTVVSRSSTLANSSNLAPDFVAALQQRWSGSVRERQELLGELIEDAEGALWSRAQLDTLRFAPGQDVPSLDRIVVAVDPPASIGPAADACGIIAAGAYGEGLSRRAVVLADHSVQGLGPQQWANRAVALARTVGAHEIIAEANNGGEMVRAVLQAAAPDMFVRLVRASEGKRSRAEPMAAYYAQGRVRHAAVFAELEDEMCGFGAEGFNHSPDRVDALVWALTTLFAGSAPRLRTF